MENRDNDKLKALGAKISLLHQASIDNASAFKAAYIAWNEATLSCAQLIIEVKGQLGSNEAAFEMWCLEYCPCFNSHNYIHHIHHFLKTSAERKAHNITPKKHLVDIKEIETIHKRITLQDEVNIPQENLPKRIVMEDYADEQIPMPSCNIDITKRSPILPAEIPRF